MENKISISFPYESKEEFEERQKKLINDIFNERLSLSDSRQSASDFLTRKETAKRLHISLPTLSQHVKDGILKAYRLKGRVLFKLEEIENSVSEVESLKFRRAQ